MRFANMAFVAALSFGLTAAPALSSSPSYSGRTSGGSSHGSVAAGSGGRGQVGMPSPSESSSATHGRHNSQTDQHAGTPRPGKPAAPPQPVTRRPAPSQSTLGATIPTVGTIGDPSPVPPTAFTTSAATPAAVPPVSSTPVGQIPSGGQSPGGSAGLGSLDSTGGTTASRSAATPRNTAGGGLDSIEDCMSFWDAQTHMTKSEWRATCIRTKNGLDQTPLR